MAEREVTFAEAWRQVASVVDQLQSVHGQLAGIARRLPEPALYNPLEDVGEELEAGEELRRVVECVLTDRIGMALGDLRALLARTRGKGETP